MAAEIVSGNYSGYLFLIAACYMALMIGIGYIIQRRKDNSASGYLIAGKKIGALMVGGTIFSTNWSGGVLLGAVGTAYAGYAACTIGDPWASCVTLIIAALFFCAILRKLKIVSITEVYRLRFGRRGAAAASFIGVMCMILWTASGIAALTAIFRLFTTFDPYLCAVISGAVVILYTYLGGMTAVIWTDNIQAVMILAGLFVIIPAGIIYAGGIETVSALTPEGFWNVFPNNAPAVADAGYGFNPAGILCWLAAFCGMGLGYLESPDLAQRILCARDTSAAKKGAVFGSALYGIAGLFSMIIALLAIVLVSQGAVMPSGESLGSVLETDSNFALPALACILFNEDTAGSSGIILMSVFIGALIAAIMSSASSTIFAAAGSIASYIRHGSLAENSPSSEGMYLLSRRLVVIVGIVGILLSFFISSLYWMMIFSATIMFNCLFWPFIGALFWKRCSGTSAAVSMAAGFAGVILCVIAQSLSLGAIAIEPHDSFWVAVQTFVPWLMSGAAMFASAYLTYESDPPAALCDTEGNVVKWGDLKRSS